jgi:hypothetical protein
LTAFLKTPSLDITETNSEAIMFFSHHSKDNPKTKIDIELLETDDQVTDDFKGFPILSIVGELHLYWRKEEFETFIMKGLQTLQELDRKVIDKNL